MKTVSERMRSFCLTKPYGKSKMKLIKQDTGEISVKKKIGILLVMLMALCLTACGDKTDEHAGHDHEQEDTTKVVANLRIGLSAYEGQPNYKAAQEFAQRVESESDGAIKATVYGQSELGSDEELLGYLANNENRVDIVIADLSNLVQYEHKIDISQMPFLLADYNEAKSFVNSTPQQSAARNLSEHNMRVLAYYSGGFRGMVMNQKSVNDAKDLQDATIATTSNHRMGEIAMRIMGARTIPLKYEETRQALQQGRCDGFEGTVTEIYENSLYQGQTYFVETNHSYSTLGFVISEELWKGLSQEHQEIIEKAAVSSGNASVDFVRQQEQQMIRDMEKRGVHIQRPALKSFWANAESFIRGQASTYGSIADEAIIWKQGQMER